MSYWAGYESQERVNMTSNVAPMWRLAGADLAEMKGKPAAEVRLILATAVRNMLSEPDKYKALNPENGWGDYGSCVIFLTSLAILSSEVDDAEEFYVSR